MKYCVKNQNKKSTKYMNSGILLGWESKKMWTALSTNQILRKELQEGKYIFLKLKRSWIHFLINIYEVKIYEL